jgi:hypothetical protein
VTRATRKKARPGELRMFYGRLPDDSSPDVCFAWGDGCSKRDGALLHWIIGSKRAPAVPGREWEPSLIEELESRGYDLSTISFSIKKKESKP